ncbi:alpha/beta hydrolase [Actinomadura barringtoniae]|uniref:Alpha/beta hydrolase n=1 Tax=Actinomadura barringtoniae TaxID=1427535 RepID=A0A939PNC6_9ACTN|nr:alpha/beta hydrolase [Actinomadura barringtoniae]MBO2453089.1 alpha/beta hydrolase [Actinomadura barringtoniae]
MFRTIKSSAVIAVCCAVASTGLAGCKDEDDWDPLDSNAGKASADPFIGTKKFDVGGKAVNASCSGNVAKGEPVIVLMHGGGDSLGKMAAIQKTLSKENRVCSYDRLGAGGSDKPDGPQDFSSSGKILTGLLDHLAGSNPVVLAGHSLGGILAARYAPEHRDRVKGLVLMDATPPTMIGDISKAIPKTAKGPAAEVRAQNLAIFHGQNPEKLVITDGPVGSAGDIPVEVIRHGKPYLAAIPQYGPLLEKAWAAGQRTWLALSSHSKLSVAAKSGHYIYLERPDLAVRAIQGVAAQASR